MLKAIVRIAAAFVLLPSAAMAEPIKLKLSFFSSDRSVSYIASVKPFVDAVNAEGKGVIEIVPHISGAISRDLSQQPRLLREGAADIAYVVPGVTRDEFRGNSIVEMPGLYRDLREATLVYTRLLASNRLKGYEDYFVIGAYVTDPETFHSRAPITSLDGLKGKKIRVNNAEEISALEKFGAVPVLLQVHQISENLSNGTIDGALVPASPLNDYGIGRVATYHYFLGTSGAPILLLMNRKKFEELPVKAQDIIRQHSGEHAAEHFIKTYSASEQAIMEQLRADPKRKVVMPSKHELERADVVFKAVLAEWVAKDPDHHTLLKIVEAEIAKLRSAE